MKMLRNRTDSELVSLLKAGDHGAFTEIFNRYWEPLINAANRRLHSRVEAEEAIQELFISLYLRHAELEIKTTLQGYLMQALKYKVIDAFRRQQLAVVEGAEGAAEARVDPSAMPDEQLEVKELKERIRRVAEQLPLRCREVFLLSRFEQLSIEEIAQRMDISTSTVKKHLNKALHILHGELERGQLGLVVIGLLCSKIL